MAVKSTGQLNLELLLKGTVRTLSVQNSHYSCLRNEARLVLVITPNKKILAGICLTPFSPSNVRGVLYVHSGHSTCVFCNLAHFVTQPSQKVWPHSSSRGMWLPIGFETSESKQN